MHIEALFLSFVLDGCRSLKERRARTAGFRDRIGRQAALAVCELAEDGALRRSDWCVIAVGAHRAQVDRLVEQVRETALRTVDGELTELRREAL